MCLTRAASSENSAAPCRHREGRCSSSHLRCCRRRNRPCIPARVEEILAAGAERAEITVEQVLRELAVLGFSDIGKVVRWRPEAASQTSTSHSRPSPNGYAAEPTNACVVKSKPSNSGRRHDASGSHYKHSSLPITSDDGFWTLCRSSDSWGEQTSPHRVS